MSIIHFSILFVLLFPIICLGQESLDTLKIDSTETYFFVDSYPTMQNGESINKGFSSFFASEFQYPDTIECIKVSYIYFEFVIKYDGTISNKKVRFNRNTEECPKDYESLTEAGLEMLDKFPKCIPGKHNGKLVNVRFYWPVHVMFQ